MAKSRARFRKNEIRKRRPTWRSARNFLFYFRNETRTFIHYYEGFSISKCRFRGNKDHEVHEKRSSSEFDFGKTEINFEKYQHGALQMVPFIHLRNKTVKFMHCYNFFSILKSPLEQNR